MQIAPMRAELSAALEILASLFYRRPDADQLAALAEPLSQWPELGSQGPDQARALATALSATEFEAISRDHYDLFEAPKGRKAYPWGSVYTHKDNLLFADSCRAYQAFLREQGMQFELTANEPVDHIGLMLGALAHLVAQQQDDAAQTLLGEHLLPWAGRLFECVQEGASTAYYRALTTLTESLLLTLRDSWAVPVRIIPLYK
ncbi:TorD/DmsD family molecular chaperone [Ferrimonas marina]|uniref:Chaperone TorD involved in molybdoenzyme TorA maturation n=1 Tax=Ferrimonas marina TaxID=299255 RepID=A0A1M5XU96_9GAMM|nr:molecular chaperone TorD family protein [Ferrimonas marina]SHI03309.1 chaperone TorD involved in molybdoenzyme TorA maturation [Ferrimonas marina]